MKYLQGSFSVALGGKDYRDGWDAIFGKKADVSTEEPKEQELDEQTTEEVLAELTEEAEALEVYGIAEAIAESDRVAGHRHLPGGGVRGPRK